MSDLSELLRRAAVRWPQAAAVCAPSGTLTYAELDAAADAAATGLWSVGATPGDRVAVALGHDLPAYVLPFACARAGVTALLLNSALQPARWEEQLTMARPALGVVDAVHAGRLRQAAGALTLVDAAAALPLDGPVAQLPPPAAPDAPLALIGTSGTTGVPKLTQVTGRGLLAAARGYVELLGLCAADRTLVVLPLAYIGPLSAQLTTMPLVGGCAVLPGDTRPSSAARALLEHAVTHLDAVPSWLGVLARERDLPDLPAWRTLIYGGAPMPAQTVARLAARYPHVTMWDVWGLSETHGPATARRRDIAVPAQAGDVGHPLPGVRVEARDPDGGTCPPGATGELHVSGDNVTPGYADDPETTARVLRHGWLATGDIGVVCADGSVQVLDRQKDVILRGGMNVFSVQVEQVLSSTPAVAEAAVFAVPDALGGEAVAAAVVLAEGAALDVRALRRRVAEQIGTHAVPRRIRAVRALPRNANGKIDKCALRKQDE